MLEQALLSYCTDLLRCGFKSELVYLTEPSRKLANKRTKQEGGLA